MMKEGTRKSHNWQETLRKVWENQLFHFRAFNKIKQRQSSWNSFYFIVGSDSLLRNDSGGGLIVKLSEKWKTMSEPPGFFKIKDDYLKIVNSKVFPTAVAWYVIWFLSLLLRSDNRRPIKFSPRYRTQGPFCLRKSLRYSQEENFCSLKELVKEVREQTHPFFIYFYTSGEYLVSISFVSPNVQTQKYRMLTAG